MSIWARCLCTYCGVLGAAGEGNAALFPTGVSIGAVKVDVEVPVVRSKGAAALPLKRGDGKEKHVALFRAPILGALYADG